MALLLLGGRVLAEGTMAPDAQAHFDAATRYFNISDYDDAIKELKAGYLVDPQPRFLYSIAQAERLSGNCKEAALEYNRYLGASASTTDADERGRRNNAQAMMAQCQAGSGPASEATSAPGKPGSTSTHTSTPSTPPLTLTPTPKKVPGKAPDRVAGATPPPPPPSPPLSATPGGSVWDRHEIAILTGAGAVVALGGGVVFGLMGKSADNAAHSYPATPGDAANDASSAKNDYLIGNVLLGVGAAAAVVSAGLWIWAPGGGSGHGDVALSASPLPGGAAASVSGMWSGL
jgi:hypothetical protein